MAEELKQVGEAIPRLDALERVTGQGEFTGDVQRPGMLYAKVLRSPHPHAKILSIDTQRALETPGVKAIITHENCKVIWARLEDKHPRYLFNNPVRFVGDPIAAVAATDRHTAEAAMQKISVQYEPLPFVLDAEEALRDGAPSIQEGGNNLTPNRRGEFAPDRMERGDVEKGFAEADKVFEEEYRTKHINNAQMEPRVAVAEWNGDKLTVWASTQGISNCKRDVARYLDLPPEKVQIICKYMGGGFGNKNQCQDLDLMAAVLSKEAGKPVKLELSRKEDFIGIHGRWPTKQYYKIGVKSDGTLTAIDLKAYSGMGPYKKSSGAVAGMELFRCPNVRREVYPVYTNMTVSANFRAPSYPQGVFGIESLMDHIAHELKIDPVEFHLKNYSRQYQDHIPYTSSGLKDCLIKGAEIFDWKKRWSPPGSDPGSHKRGVGMAMGHFGARIGPSAAVLRLDSKGTLWVHVGVTDVGTAAKTTMAMLAAEAMDMDLDQVQVVWGDTDRCPYSVGESGSRTTNFTGYAVLEAAKELKKQLAEDGPPKGSEVRVGQASPAPKLEGKARYAFSTNFVEIEVDTELGEVNVLKFVAMHDSGRIINPLTSVSQIRGGVIQGISMALYEELLYDQATGAPLTPGYYGARIATHLDAPEIEVHFIEPEDAYGPYGAKTVGEPPIVATVAAIANAFFNATGKRITELPMTRDRILEVLA